MKNTNFRVYIFNIIKDFLSNHTLEELSEQVSSIKVTEECGHKITGYIHRNKLSTFSQYKKNGKRVSFTYTANFSVKCYSSGCYIADGTRGSRSDQVYKDIKEKGMSKREVYYAVLKKYPNEILDIKLYSET
jgi:hypothetical protein